MLLTGSMLFLTKDLFYHHLIFVLCRCGIKKLSGVQTAFMRIFVFAHHVFERWF